MRLLAVVVTTCALQVTLSLFGYIRGGGGYCSSERQRQRGRAIPQHGMAMTCAPTIGAGTFGAAPATPACDRKALLEIAITSYSL